MQLTNCRQVTQIIHDEDDDDDESGVDDDDEELSGGPGRTWRSPLQGLHSQPAWIILFFLLFATFTAARIFLTAAKSRQKGVPHCDEKC